MSRTRFDARSRSWLRSGRHSSETWRCTTGEGRRGRDASDGLQPFLPGGAKPAEEDREAREALQGSVIARPGEARRDGARSGKS
eukprot:180826-Hanusia_phi.AAC.13